MRYRPKIHPYITLLQWYPFKASPSAELLTAYATDVGQQIAASIEAYRNNAEEQVVDEGDPESVRIIRHHGGLDDESWDLHDVFEDYFPNLQRASAVITLVAFYERELEDLCALIQEIEGYKVSVKDMYGTGIDRSVSYLDLVCRIDVVKESKERKEVRAIQVVRGALAHGGRVDPAKNNKLKDAIDESPLLSYTDEIKVDENYPAYVIGAFNRYFGALHRSIKTIYQAKLVASKQEQAPPVLPS